MVAILDGRVPARAPHALDRRLVGLINDPRDLPFVYLSWSALFVLGGGAIALYFADPVPWWGAVLYLAVLLLVFVDRYTLMLHNVSHRRLYNKRFSALNQVVPIVLAPFMGQSPYTYFAHHIGMHHPENNLADDASSTMRYQRDSLRGFLHYLGTFLLVGLPQLIRYHLRNGRKRMARMALLGELSWLAGVVALGFVNLTATLVVFVAPYLLIRFLMMAGNWAQHAFIDAADPANPYRNSITSINTRYNRRCFNDGYHIGHHVKASRHWSEMPSDFERNIERYRDEKAVVFQGLDYFQIWLLLMLKRYGTLAKHVVDLGEATPRTHEETIAFLRERTRRIPASPQGLSGASA